MTKGNEKPVPKISPRHLGKNLSATNANEIRLTVAIPDRVIACLTAQLIATAMMNLF